VIKANTVRQQQMPDVRGMGLKDALYLLENIGLKVQANGKGKVMTQSVQSGVVLTKGTIVYLQLS
jgi:cell division protein FtsI (penicillin-binding protein 3)